MEGLCREPSVGMFPACSSSWRVTFLLKIHPLCLLRDNEGAFVNTSHLPASEVYIKSYQERVLEGHWRKKGFLPVSALAHLPGPQGTWVFATAQPCTASPGVSSCKALLAAVFAHCVLMLDSGSSTGLNSTTQRSACCSVCLLLRAVHTKGAAGVATGGPTTLPLPTQLALKPPWPQPHTGVYFTSEGIAS